MPEVQQQRDLMSFQSDMRKLTCCSVVPVGFNPNWPVQATNELRCASPPRRPNHHSSSCTSCQVCTNPCAHDPTRSGDDCLMQSVAGGKACRWLHASNDWPSCKAPRKSQGHAAPAPLQACLPKGALCIHGCQHVQRSQAAPHCSAY